MPRREIVDAGDCITRVSGEVSASSSRSSPLSQRVPAQSYPDHIIRLIVPFPAGGSNDVVARLIAPHLEKALGQTVIVDNRPAAGGIVGSDAVAKAAPDGHTLLLVASSHTVTPALNSKLPYNTERDFAPISLDQHQRDGVLRQPEGAGEQPRGIRRAREEEPGQSSTTRRRAPAARPTC